MVEVWNFIHCYHDLLGVSNVSQVPLNKVSFFNLSIQSSKETPPYFANAIQILTKFLISEEIKKRTSIRKQMRVVGWVKTLFQYTLFSALCDNDNYVEYVRGFFNPSVHEIGCVFVGWNDPCR